MLNFQNLLELNQKVKKRAREKFKKFYVFIVFESYVIPLASARRADTFYTILAGFLTESTYPRNHHMRPS